MSLIYLDNSATSYPKAPGVADAVRDNLLSCGTSGRASYDEALEGSRVLYECRRNLAKLFSLPDSSRIILNSGATESLNTIIKGFLKPGMKALTSMGEHNSVMRPLNTLMEKGVTVERFHCLNDGTADLDDYKSKLKSGPDLVILCHSSNVSGALFPVKEMIRDAHEAGALVCLDGAQSAGHKTINLIKLNADFYCFAGHKGLLGPAGTGGFYIKDGIEISSLLEGGTGSASEEEIQPRFLPDLYESGTRNIPGLAGLRASTDFLLTTGVDVIGKKEKDLALRLIEGLKMIEGITLIGPENPASRNSVVSFFHDRVDLSELAEGLDDAEIAQRMGLHCAPSAHKSLGTYDRGGTIRFSPGYFNSEEDIDSALKAVREIVNG
ncbi:aminotransferase class V-fold PLP-dependent enzyme [Spirochaeta isovalerica]|uniref:Cysteine desulfurase family protein n=1 Tax=Spirochaeta isovalerica TaxID=150 RepID=A0A841RAY1_9SPIO|nr:aminotransferase class V-fold PLP-dependent enzyme [Spirochaeta isovalerica]MBB6479582.1 cysteine desulfurase family protein [Spirochaeta isovalerica]